MSKQRVYTFSSYDVEGLDKQVNDFIKSEKALTVTSISHSCCSVIKSDGDTATELVTYSISLSM
jgi:hypothetical protein